MYRSGHCRDIRQDDIRNKPPKAIAAAPLPEALLGGHKTLASSGRVKVSPLCLGSMSFRGTSQVGLPAVTSIAGSSVSIEVLRGGYDFEMASHLAISEGLIRG